MYQAFITTLQANHNLTDMEVMNLLGFIQDNVKFLLSEDGDITPYLEDFQSLQYTESIEAMGACITAVEGGDYNSQHYDGIGFNEVFYDENTGKEVDVEVAAFLYEVIHGLKEA